MTSLTLLAENFQWKLSLIILIAGFAIPALMSPLLRLIPVLRRSHEMNRAAVLERQKRSFYMPVQRRSIFWGITANFLIFALLVPFCVTAEPQPFWQILRDIVGILMLYDFVYYFTHRFVFHDGGLGPGPLMWAHAIHHQNRNPCRKDSSYLHPIEIIIGNVLYGFSIGVLALAMGRFSAATLTITTIAFTQINLHNHDLIDVEDRFPYRYLRYTAFMHHVHHARFTAGNFATITLFYDWLFGTYDTGQGWRRSERAAGMESTTRR